MPIQPPILEGRDWQQLRDELVRRIPVHAPEWTDHSAADPGIALLELFAHLGEGLLRDLNRAPEAAQLAARGVAGARATAADAAEGRDRA
jgi:hypothetical protein